MKAPDKIYVHTGAHLGLFTLTTIPVGGPAEQEFIRKDALLEWIKEVRAIPHDGAMWRDNAFQEVINKLNSM